MAEFWDYSEVVSYALTGAGLGSYGGPYVAAAGGAAGAAFGVYRTFWSEDVAPAPSLQVQALNQARNSARQTAETYTLTEEDAFNLDAAIDEIAFLVGLHMATARLWDGTIGAFADAIGSLQIGPTQEERLRAETERAASAVGLQIYNIGQGIVDNAADWFKPKPKPEPVPAPVDEGLPVMAWVAILAALAAVAYVARTRGLRHGE